VALEKQSSSLSPRVGLYYGSSTCYTEMVAERIQGILGKENLDLHNIATADFSTFHDYDFLLFGIPTWDFGELQEDWDERWEDLDNIDLNGKTCAIFGLGDQDGYADWFQDAIGYLYYKLASIGAELVGEWPNQDYEFNDSKGLNEQKTCFLGLALDDENQPDKTEQRLQTWLAQIGLIRQ